VGPKFCFHAAHPNGANLSLTLDLASLLSHISSGVRVLPLLPYGTNWAPDPPDRAPNPIDRSGRIRSLFPPDPPDQWPHQERGTARVGPRSTLLIEIRRIRTATQIKCPYLFKSGGSGQSLKSPDPPELRSFMLFINI
jgi:hypothetical protein